jgi:hypothetical protein
MLGRAGILIRTKERLATFGGMCFGME